MKVSTLLIFLSVTSVVTFPANQTLAWHDATHMAVVKAAGLDNYVYLAVGADMAKEKAGQIETQNHYNNTSRGVRITPEMVLAQVSDYNKSGDSDGHLYGAIIAALNDYLLKSSSGKYAMYPLGYAMHYLGDLSMPFHNIAYDTFNKTNHAANDGIIEISSPRDESTEVKVARLAAEIQKRMKKLPIIQFSTDVNVFNKELAMQIAAIANNASALGYSMQDASPPRTRLTEEEAYLQLAQSAQLLQAVAAAILQ
ncbi:MAG: hypothetical protein EHM79_03940 [Geobacter sp.]|nr:MAG: hypothetical protein EHM79_03940 [Geobacter sp.]